MRSQHQPQMPTTVRLLSIAFAALAGYGAAGIGMLFIGPATGTGVMVTLMAIFVAAYVPGIFAARKLLLGLIAEVAPQPGIKTHAA